MYRHEGTTALKDDRKYTLADWKTWPEGARFAPVSEWRRGESAESALLKGFIWKRD